LNVNLLRELRYVATEVGYREARRMPVEIRRWWIEQMSKEGEARQAQIDAMNGRKTANI
jgi:hypothetical protein